MWDFITQPLDWYIVSWGKKRMGEMEMSWIDWSQLNGGRHRNWIITTGFKIKSRVKNLVATRSAYWTLFRFLCRYVVTDKSFVEIKSSGSKMKFVFNVPKIAAIRNLITGIRFFQYLKIDCVDFGFLFFFF